MKSRSVARVAEGEAMRGDVQASKDTIALQNIHVPQPVFFCSVEPASMAIQNGKYMTVHHMHVVCTSHACYMYITCMYMYVTCMLHVHHMHVTCTSHACTSHTCCVHCYVTRSRPRPLLSLS